MNRKINALVVYNILLTIAITILCFKFFADEKEITGFQEIDVERINIREKDGKIKMIITNKERQPTGLVLDGKNYEYGRGKSGGILLFNDEGEENGGFLFGGNEEEHGVNLSFDQFKQGELVALTSREKTVDGIKKKLYGLALFEKPDTISTKQELIEEERIAKIKNEEERNREYEKLKEKGYYGYNSFFAGRLWNGETGLFLMDSKGESKIRLYIDNEGNPKLELHDKNGNDISIEDLK